MRHELYSSALLKRINQRLEPGLEIGHPITPGGFGPGGARAQVIAGLEAKVSLLQVAHSGINRIGVWLNEMGSFLAQAQEAGSKDPLAPTVANRFIEDRLLQIKRITEAASFGSQALLNGKSGVLGRAEGAGLQFVRGAASTKSSQGRGYPVAIAQEAKSASLLGATPLLPQEIKRESWIALKEGQSEARYKVRGDEDPKELVAHIQEAIDQAGLDLGCYLTRDMRLLVLSNQLGAGPRFEGISQKTRLLSSLPGEAQLAEPGRDVNGQIGTEPAFGRGGYLIGQKGNPRTDGLTLYFEGEIAYPGQIVGYVEVAQKGLLVPMDLGGQQIEILSLPALGPELLSVGVKNPSGFKSLEQIRAGSNKERKDALKLVNHAKEELKTLGDELKWKEEVYVERAIDLLTSPGPKPAGQELLGLSQAKAKQMAEELGDLLKQTLS